MASCQPTSLRSFSSDRSHTLSHASYLRDSAMIDDTMVIPSHQVCDFLLLCFSYLESSLTLPVAENVWSKFVNLKRNPFNSVEKLAEEVVGFSKVICCLLLQLYWIPPWRLYIKINFFIKISVKEKKQDKGALKAENERYWWNYILY